MDHFTAVGGTAVYPISKTIADYLCNSLGEVGSQHHPINHSGINQILLSQWKYLRSIRSLYNIVRLQKQGKVDSIVANQAIENFNKTKGASYTIEQIREYTLERPCSYGFSPCGDPWIFYKTKAGYCIDEILSLEIPSIPGNLSEYEQHFLPIADFMEVLYFADWSQNILWVIRSPFIEERPLIYDNRTTEEVKNRFNLTMGYTTYEENEDFVGLSYVLSPEVEQSWVMEMTHPELV
tara:strand:- start:537 stop:1247 length:711 start_codon:yes stop_codon:yes gene_type:complete